MGLARLERVRGLVFDLDGTLVDSGLDFEAMRREMGLPPGVPILESLQDLPPARANLCRAMLDRHEEEGARRARRLPGVAPFLQRVAARGLKFGLMTRNSRAATERTLRRCGLHFRDVLTRDDGPVKPDPWAVHHLCRRWGCVPAEVVVIGDFHFDLEAGRAAGARSVLLCNGRTPGSVRGHELADYCLPSFSRSDELLRCLPNRSREPSLSKAR